MRLRSLLFVPGDSERKIAKGRASEADALILDLEDAVAPARKAEARGIVAKALGQSGGPGLWVRVNPRETGLLQEDLAAVVRPGLAGLVLPKVGGMAEVEEVHRDLSQLEEKAGTSTGSTPILVIATETPAAVFALGGYRSHPRLAGLTWGAEDLSACIGAETNRAADGNWSDPFRLARALCLLAAGAAGVPAIDTVWTDYRDLEGLAADCDQARADGFVGRMAIHPDQVAVINQAFTPDAAAVAEAMRIVAAFKAAPEAGTLGLEGRMLDRPHLVRAERVLRQAGLS